MSFPGDEIEPDEPQDIAGLLKSLGIRDRVIGQQWHFTNGDAYIGSIRPVGQSRVVARCNPHTLCSLFLPKSPHVQVHMDMITWLAAGPTMNCAEHDR